MEQASRGKVHAGRVVLPADMRKEFGIEDGAEVIFRRTAHGIEIRTAMQALREAQELFSQLKKPGESVVDALLAGRREEASRE